MFKEFVKLYKPHKKLFALDLASAFMMSLINLAFPILVSYIIDDVVPSRNIRLLFILCAAAVAGYMLRYAFEYVVTYWGHMLGVSLENDMRKNVFAHFEKLSFSYFDSERTGHIISRLTTDIFDISEFAHHGPENIFTAAVILIGSFCVLITTDVLLTLVIFSIIPIMCVVAVLNNTKWEKAYLDVKKVNAELTSDIEDSFSGVRVVKAFTNEEYQYERFSHTCDKYSDTKKVTYRFMALFVSNIHFFTALLKLAVIFIGGYQIYTGSMTMGVLVEFLLFVDIFIRPVQMFTDLIEDFQKARSGFARCREILNTEPEIKDRPNAKDAGVLKGDIEFKNVTFNYKDDAPVLDDFNLSIRPGEKIAIVGQSGAGKTTLCSLLPRFYDVSDGAILIGGTDIRDYTQFSLRKNIGIVQQDVFLFSGTIKENIGYGDINATDENIRRAAKFANLDEFIKTLPHGYDTMVGERGVRLSGGQKQRVAIARTFLKNPPILILDEATSSLDNENEHFIQESFDMLAKNRTTIIIAHRLQTIENAERIIVMNKGRIVEEGTHEELLKKNGAYSALYSAQKK